MRQVTPHVAQNTSERSNPVAGRTTRHLGYAPSQRARKRVEEIFGWVRAAKRLLADAVSRVERTGLGLYLVAAVYDLIRRAGLLAPPMGLAPTTLVR